ncbi:MAG: MBL fold metallo-hydrolase [bacterium]
MKITKLGHCCLLLEFKGVRILTDPGIYTAEEHSKLKKIDYIFITHEHADHYHLDSIRVVMDHNPDVLIYTNESVSAILTREGIYHHLIKDGGEVLIDDGKISIKGVGHKHAIMHKSIPASDNTGFLFDESFFLPGDALTDPKQPIDILALPVAGPWLKISEAIDYAIQLKPRVCFPIHDTLRVGSTHNVPKMVLPANGIEFVPMEEGDKHEF